MQLFALTFVLVLVCSLVNANEWVYLRSEVVLGYSDNIFQDNYYKKSDEFIGLAGFAKYKTNEASYTGKLNLNIYFKEKTNNSVNYYINRNSNLKSNLELNLGLGGFSYLDSNVATTDLSYNYFYFTSSLINNFSCVSDMYCYFEPGIKLSTFKDLDGRFDVLIYGHLDAVWNYSQNLEISPYIELGFVQSNKAYFRKNYFDIGVSLDKQLDAVIKFVFDVFMRNTSYPDRIASEILIVKPGNGRGNANTNLTLHERTTLLSFSGAIKKRIDSKEYSLGLNYSTQTSVSGFYNYNELQILAALNLDF